MIKTLLDKLGWTGYGTRILGGLGTALGVFAMNLTPEQIVAILGAKGPGAIMAATGVLTFLRGQVNAQNAAAVSPQAKAHFLTVLLAGIVASSLLFGCASWTGSQKLAATVGIQYATAKFVEHEPEDKREARAIKVINATVALKAVASDTSTTIDSLQGEAFDLIEKTNLGPADRVLVNTLVAAVIEELRQRVSTGLLKEDDKILVIQVLDNIAAAARGYVSLTPSS
jgi:hypothetical protein